MIKSTVLTNERNKDGYHVLETQNNIDI